MFIEINEYLVSPDLPTPYYCLININSIKRISLSHYELRIYYNDGELQTITFDYGQYIAFTRFYYKLVKAIKDAY